MRLPDWRSAATPGPPIPTVDEVDFRALYSKTKYVASFIGFAPADHPKILVSVVVDEPQGLIYGGEVAAPAFQEILNFALPYLKIPPN